MTFRDTTTTSDSLTHFVDFILGLPQGETSQFPLAMRAQSANLWKYLVALKIWETQDIWIFDDSGNTGLPEASQTLTNSTEEYTLPATALKIRRVTVLDAAGNPQEVHPLGEERIKVALPEFYKNDSMPQFYRLIKRSIILHPAPATASVTLTNGLTIYFEKEINEFTASTTTTEIGFGEPFDRIVGYGSAWDYAAPRGKQSVVKTCETQLTNFFGVGPMDVLKRHFSSRSKGVQTRFYPRPVRVN